MKKNFTILKFGFVVLILMLAACGNSATSNVQPQQPNANTNLQADNKTFPPLPPAKKIVDGVIVHEIRLDKTDEASDVWVYLPEKPTGEKLPAVLISAAGSYLWNGKSLGKGDQTEHLPYVKKGYIVIAYETPGDLDDANQASDAQLFKAAKDFKNSRAGIVSQQNALNYALEKIPSIDAEKIYIAGHSSAATHALLVAANEPRIKAAIAYAPAVDLEKRLSTMFASFEKEIPGFKNFILESSPKNNIAKIKCPIFIFQALDDSVVPVEDTKNFVAELQKNNSSVTFETVKTGDHYDAMIEQGIAKAIEWLNKIKGK